MVPRLCRRYIGLRRHAPAHRHLWNKWRPVGATRHDSTTVRRCGSPAASRTRSARTDRQDDDHRRASLYRVRSSICNNEATTTVTSCSLCHRIIHCLNSHLTCSAHQQLHCCRKAASGTARIAVTFYVKLCLCGLTKIARFMIIPGIRLIKWLRCDIQYRTSTVFRCLGTQHLVLESEVTVITIRGCHLPTYRQVERLIGMSVCPSVCLLVCISTSCIILEVLLILTSEL